MRKMADGFVAVRRAELLLDGDVRRRERDERELDALDWKQFTDEEFALCPPIVAMGGDGAMLDIGFQNLSRLLASGKPIRVIVLDTQVYSNTGGQACTSGLHRPGVRHGGVRQGAARQDGGAQGARADRDGAPRRVRAPVVAGVGVAPDGRRAEGAAEAAARRCSTSTRPARWSTASPTTGRSTRRGSRSRAAPSRILTFDPDAGASFAECLSLDGNPSVDDDVADVHAGVRRTKRARAQSMELPLTIADWAATEGRFSKHFKSPAERRCDDSMVPFHEYLALSAEAIATAGRRSSYALGRGQEACAVAVSGEIVRLAEERQQLWSQLRELAGVVVAEPTARAGARVARGGARRRSSTRRGRSTRRSSPSCGRRIPRDGAAARRGRCCERGRLAAVGDLLANHAGGPVARGRCGRAAGAGALSCRPCRRRRRYGDGAATPCRARGAAHAPLSAPATARAASTPVAD